MNVNTAQINSSLNYSFRLPMLGRVDIHFFLRP